MKRFAMVGGLVAVLLAVAASQHSPPAPTQGLDPEALVAKVAPSFEPVATEAVDLSNVMTLDPVLVLAVPPRTEQVSKSKSKVLRPTWRVLPVGLWINENTRHVSNASMRGWGFL